MSQKVSKAYEGTTNRTTACFHAHFIQDKDVMKNERAEIEQGQTDDLTVECRPQTIDVKPEEKSWRVKR
jgi:hypothetical protein